MHLTYRSFLLGKLLFNWVWNCQVNLQHLCNQHLDHLLFIFLIICLDFSDLLLSLFLQLGLKFLISFLNDKWTTSALICSNYAYFYFLYLATSSSAAYLAYFNFLCLHEKAKKERIFLGKRVNENTFIFELFRWYR